VSRSLPPAAIKELSIGSHSITIAGFGVLGDLQQALGKT
jgi:hypothetical protein